MAERNLTPEAQALYDEAIAAAEKAEGKNLARKKKEEIDQMTGAFIESFANKQQQVDEKGMRRIISAVKGEREKV